MLRFLSRSLLASYFIADGLKKATNPHEYADSAAGLNQTILPAVRKALPDQVADRLPATDEGIARITGIAQLLGGLGVATGVLRRPAALVLAASLVPEIIASSPLGKGENKSTDNLLTKLSLLGGTLLASLDTQGKPSLKYQAKAGSKLLGRAAEDRLNLLEAQLGGQGKAARAFLSGASGLSGATGAKLSKGKLKKLRRHAEALAKKTEAEAKIAFAAAAKEAEIRGRHAERDLRKAAKRAGVRGKENLLKAATEAKATTFGEEAGAKVAGEKLKHAAHQAEERLKHAAHRGEERVKHARRHFG